MRLPLLDLRTTGGGRSCGTTTPWPLRVSMGSTWRRVNRPVKHPTRESRTSGGKVTGVTVGRLTGSQELLVGPGLKLTLWLA